jgi:hypothetical protein
MSALLLAAWFIGGRKPLEGGELGAVAVFGAIAAPRFDAQSLRKKEVITCRVAVRLLKE